MPVHRSKKEWRRHLNKLAVSDVGLFISPAPAQQTVPRAELIARRYAAQEALDYVRARRGLPKAADVITDDSYLSRQWRVRAREGPHLDEWSRLDELTAAIASSVMSRSFRSSKWTVVNYNVACHPGAGRMQGCPIRASFD